MNQCTGRQLAIGGTLWIKPFEKEYQAIWFSASNSQKRFQGLGLGRNSQVLALNSKASRMASAVIW